MLTAGAGGVLAWSGVDTLQNPGAENVRKACAGKGPECPEYKLGLESQLRTNVLIGATAAAGMLISEAETRSESPADKLARLVRVAIPDGATLDLPADDEAAIALLRTALKDIIRHG